MDKKEIENKINKKLMEKETSVRNCNAFDALFNILPPAAALWQIFFGVEEKLKDEKTTITLDMILDLLLGLDKKYEGDRFTNSEAKSLNIILEKIVSAGNVIGLKANTSNEELRRLFSEKEVNVSLKDIRARGDVTGVNLSVDKELTLEHKLNIEGDFGGMKASIKFNPNIAKITFGKGL